MDKHSKALPEIQRFVERFEDFIRLPETTEQEWKRYSQEQKKFRESVEKQAETVRRDGTKEVEAVGRSMKELESRRFYKWFVCLGYKREHRNLETAMKKAIDKTLISADSMIFSDEELVNHRNQLQNNPPHVCLDFEKTDTSEEFYIYSDDDLATAERAFAKITKNPQAKGHYLKYCNALKREPVNI